jgi:hypothetical protein
VSSVIVSVGSEEGVKLTWTVLILVPRRLEPEPIPRSSRSSTVDAARLRPNDEDANR